MITTPAQRTVEIVDVTPRDGLQNETTLLSVKQKQQLIDMSLAAGIKRIEVGSFVNPKTVPSMADTHLLMQQLNIPGDVTTIGLVMNMRGAQQAYSSGIKELGCVVTATDAFGVKNQGRTRQQTITEALQIADFAQTKGLQCNVTIAVAFGCPFSGSVEQEQVSDTVKQLSGGYFREIALADTIGVAAPSMVDSLLANIKRTLSQLGHSNMPLRLHFHNTRNTAVANAMVALQHGVQTLDASIGGIGGCPFAPGATGNVAMEDLLYAIRDSYRLPSDIAIANLLPICAFLQEALHKKLPSSLFSAGDFPNIG